jgi:hypothetical protein
MLDPSSASKVGKAQEQRCEERGINSERRTKPCRRGDSVFSFLRRENGSVPFPRPRLSRTNLIKNVRRGPCPFGSLPELRKGRLGEGLPASKTHLVAAGTCCGDRIRRLDACQSLTPFRIHRAPGRSGPASGRAPNFRKRLRFRCSFTPFAPSTYRFPPIDGVAGRAYTNHHSSRALQSLLVSWAETLGHRANI